MRTLSLPSTVHGHNFRRQISVHKFPSTDNFRQHSYTHDTHSCLRCARMNELKSTAYNELATAHNKRSTAYNENITVYTEKSTVYNTTCTSYNGKVTAYNDVTTASNGKNTIHNENKYHKAGMAFHRSIYIH